MNCNDITQEIDFYRKDICNLNEHYRLRPVSSYMTDEAYISRKMSDLPYAYVCLNEPNAFTRLIRENEANDLLINSPNNPSGIMYSEETLKKLASILEKKQSEYGHPIYLISDEPYREIVFKGRKCPYTACYYDNTITCYSYSKALSLPGERIGYVATSPKCEGANEIIDICGQISRFTGHNCPPSIIQLAIAETLGVYSDMSVYEKNEQILYKALTEMGFKCVEPDGTFYMFPEVPEGTADELSEKAKQFDLLLVPGTSFGCPKNFRISYCIDTEKVERSLDAFEKLAKLYF